jgi:hypothetical protein
LFLSPISATSGSICEPVLSPVSATYLADSNGYWETSTYFDTSRALYQFTFHNYYVNNSGWVEIMNELEGQLQGVGNLMSTLMLPSNILYWTAWSGHFVSTTEVAEPTTQYFNMFADVAVIFNRQYVHGIISNVDSDCNASTSSTFNPSTYIISTTYTYEEFVSNPRCSAVVDPALVGYNSFYDGDQFSLSMDVRSLVTALAVNENIISVTLLRPVMNSLTTYLYRNTLYVIGDFYSPRYPGMFVKYVWVHSAHMLLNIHVVA